MLIRSDLNIGHVTDQANHLALTTTVSLLHEFVGNDHILTHELVRFVDIPWVIVYITELAFVRRRVVSLWHYLIDYSGCNIYSKQSDI